MTTDYEYSNSKQKDLRQKLRNDAPKAEQRLWEFLRNSQLNGLKFRRQYGIGPYVVDFYCPKLRLAIEIDGDSATGRWYIFLPSTFRKGNQARWQGARYNEDYVRENGTWKIKHLRIAGPRMIADYETGWAR